MSELLCHLSHDLPHILCITEHHLNREELASFHVENYVLGSSYCRKLKNKGGVCIFIHNSITFTSIDIENYCLDQDFEACAIRLSSKHGAFCILAVYRSPQGHFNTFLTNFDLTLHKFYNHNLNFIICGDFNVDYCTENLKRTQLDGILHSYNLSSVVDFPTRISSCSYSTIDNFFIDNSYLNKFNIIPIINGLSDHDAQLLTIQLVQQHIKGQNAFYKRNINQYTIDDFLHKLSHETWAPVFEGNDVNTNFNTFLNTFLRYFYSSFPMVKVNKPHNYNSWITTGIRTSCQHKRVLYLKLRNNNNPSLKKYFKDYCRILSRVINDAKRLDYDRQILNSNNAMRISWKLINKEIGRDCKSPGVQSLVTNGRSITDYQIIANTFNNHFTTFPITISHKINTTNLSSTTSGNNQNNISFSLNHVYQNSFPTTKFRCTTTREIEYIIRSLKLTNSCGYDEIPTKLLKLCSYYISSPLNYICNRALLTGVFPDRLKYATIRPLFKKGKKDDVNNYRPISILTSFSKIFEKVMQTRLLEHLNDNNILVKEQYGFRTNLKTDNAVYYLTNEILNALNNNLSVGGVFCDLEKAFDCVNHKILLSKLEFYGITGTHHKLYKSYLSDRYQRTVLYNENGHTITSSWTKVEQGVPQGSVF